MADCYRGDKRATESKQQLRKAFFQLLREREWAKISVQDLTKTAGIHRTTFYQHYEDKFDLAQQVMDEMFDTMKAAIFAPVRKEDGQVGHEAYVYIYRFYQHLQEYEEEYQVLLKRGRALNIYQTASAFFDESFTLGLEGVAGSKSDTAHVPLDMQKQFVISAYVGTAEWWLRTGRPYSPDFMASSMIQLLEYH
ncbi:TetR family transcriptional regulator [Bacillus safensis]|uniref:TetR/AcrR family transcriptional regulator n=1 Tax=Bacillus TaxID=1386 RepID=UPI001DF79659|nr:TetR family transcriptional regulator [Bacillus safensis]MBG9834038.1 TetR family transcriptional regulator [Bacillus safensis]MBG9862993.1 TetR family transcriptional regulator [Bacillus safensis]MBG9898918.1 TetR family transcriptional regulator [Bacillus safensis]